MRVVGGRLRGRPLLGPSSGAIRPSADRLREAIFNVLQHGHDDPVPGARILDVFAGTGALGIEALSRGAAHATFVDSAGDACSLIRRNLEALGLGGSARLVRRDATRLGRAAPEPPVSLAFCDPPYGRDLAGPALRALAEGGWLAPGALVVVEQEASAAAAAWPDGFHECDRRRYGIASVAILQASGGGS